MRSRNYIFIIIAFFSFFFIFIPNVYAAIIIRYEEWPIVIILTIMLTFFINALVEFGVVFAFLKSRDIIKKELFLAVILVNFVIFLPTQTIVYFLTLFNLELFVFYVIMFSSLMILIEWLLYYLEFQNLHLKKSIPNSLSLKKAILISTVANVVSFSVIYLYPVIMMIQQYIQFPEFYSSSILLDIKTLLFT